MKDNKKHDMIFLNKEDISNSLSYEELMESIESAYKAYSEGRYKMPLRLHADMDDNTLLLMPCINDQGFGTKVLSVFPNNKAIGKPVIDGIMIVNDLTTGEPKAIMDAKIVTALRTGAVGGVAIKHLSREEADSVGVIGAGVQGFYQAIYASVVRKVKTLWIYNRSMNSLDNFVDELYKRISYAINIKVANNVEELLLNSEIVITATTSNEPVIPDNPDLIKGKCFIGIGSFKPNMREFPESLFKLCQNIYVDTEHALHESGDIMTPIKEGWIMENNVSLFGDFLKSKDNKVGDTVLFKSVGMALFDLFVSQKIFELAKKKNIGQKISCD